MIPPQPLLVKLLDIVNMLVPDIEIAPKRGRPYTYSPKVMLKCYVVMAAKRCFSHRALYAFLKRDESYAQAVRKAIGLHTIPDRRTFDRRFKGISEILISCIGEVTQTFLKEALIEIKTVAIDSTLFAAKGRIWHQKDLKKGIIPCGNIDTDARWGKSYTKGWIFGYAANVCVATGEIVLPLGADLVPANVPDGKVYGTLFPLLPKATRFVAADAGYDDKNLRRMSEGGGKRLVSPIRNYKNSSWEREEEGRFFLSREGQSIFKKRATTIEPFFGQIKDIFSLEAKLPMKGLNRVRSLVLTCIFTFQCAVYFNIQHDLPPMRVKHLIWAM